MFRKIKSPFPLHPFLISLYPVIALLAFNIKEIQPRAVLRPLLASLVLGVVVYALFWLVSRNPLKAGLLSTVFSILFFSYGHIYDAAQGVPVLEMILGKQSILSLLWLALFAGGAFLILRRLKNPQPLTRALNVFAGVLLLLPLLQFGIFEVRSNQNASSIASKVPIAEKLSAPVGQPLPDIYFIILDTYPRQDLLQDQMQFDNSSFISQLQQLGFVVEPCSQSNYTQTELSLSSTLNLNYLPALDPRFVAGFMDRTDLPAFIKESLVRRSLQALGYKTVSFGTGYAWSEIRDADIFYYPGEDGLTWLGNTAGLTQFESTFLKTTWGLLLTTIKTPGVADFSQYLNHPFRGHIDLQLFLLDTLTRVPQVSGPKFIFTHILIPHGPFVFGPDGVLPENQMVGATEDDGSDLRPADYIKGFVPQVEYINNRILPILKNLIEQSKTPPIIILQGDHGPFSLPPILNAYYLPGKKDIGLYPTITPVNSFRLIFNGFFGTNFPLLPDTSFESFDTDPFGGTIYPNTCK